jgi:hemerythrin superfamily protein
MPKNIHSNRALRIFREPVNFARNRGKDCRNDKRPLGRGPIAPWRVRRDCANGGWHEACAGYCLYRQETGMARPASVIIDMLSEDHDRLLVLFTAFQGMRESAHPESKQTLVEIACTELVIHAQIEEDHLYPALAEAFDDDFLLEHAEVEHALMRRLVAELETMQANDRLYDARFTVLSEMMRRHIEEEQTRLFPRMLRLDMPMEDLAREIAFRRSELRSEFGMPDLEGDEEDDGFRFRVSRKTQYRHH